MFDVETVGEIASIYQGDDGYFYINDVDGKYLSYEEAQAAYRVLNTSDLSFTLPVHHDTAPLPAPGIYFGMSDEQYFAIPALSASGIKKLASSPMLFWATSWLNKDKVSEEKDHFWIGKAYHCRLLEGKDEFERRYVRAIEKSDFENILETTDQIKDYISKLSFELIVDGVPQLRAMTPVAKVEEPDGKGGVRMRAAKKDDWIAQLLEADPDAPIWDNILQKFNERNAGRIQIPQKIISDIEISAKMIEADPNVSGFASGGHAEVVLIWNCPKTGVPMKAKVDKLKVKGMVDLKTYANMNDRSPERAIYQAIANMRYTIQPCVYFEGASEVRKIVRKHGASAIHVMPDENGVIDTDKEEYALKWAKHVLPDTWTWIFQQKGIAPITRAIGFSPESATKRVVDDLITSVKKRFVECSMAFGVDPWIDSAPAYLLADEDLPVYATEI